MRPKEKKTTTQMTEVTSAVPKKKVKFVPQTDDDIIKSIEDTKSDNSSPIQIIE